MKPSPELLAKAKQCRYFQGDLLALGSALPKDNSDLDAMLEMVAGSHEPLALSNMVLAALAMDRPLNARHLIVGAAQFDDILLIITFAGHCRGQLAEALLAAIRSGHMSWEREALALFIAAWACREKDEARPDGMITEARVLARKIASPDARSLLFAAANIMDDEDLWSILDPQSSPFTRQFAEQTAKSLILDLQRPVLDTIPELPPPVVLQGGTIKRAVARMGRNEPCHCGSGKKYKRCCQENDNDRLRDSSEIAGVTRQEMRESPESYLTVEGLWEMRAHDVVALKPELIPPELYGSYINRLNIFDEFETILHFLEVVGVPADLEENIVESVEGAMNAQKRELASRIAAYVPDYEDPHLSSPLSFQFARDRMELGPALELIESAALEHLDDQSPTDFLCQLFDLGCPALGILAGRGTMAYSDLWEAETVLSYILEARDRLELSPSDFAESLFEQRLLDQAGPEQETKNSVEYAHFQGAAARADDLEKKLAAKELALKTALKKAAKKQNEASPVFAAPAPTASADAEIESLQSAIVGLKKEVKENHQERNQYRRLLRTAVTNNEAVEKENMAIRAELEANLAANEALLDDAPELLLDEHVATSYPVRIPVFSDRFSSGLDRLPEAVARKTVHLAGRLAAGEEAAFQGAKRLVANRKVIRQRIGSYRLLFKLEEAELVVLECVHRRDLVKAVGRYV